VKKVLVLVLALGLLLGVSAHGTSGLFTDTETATATITAWVDEPCAYECTGIVSDTDTMVTEVNGTTVDPEENAELAWVHGNWWPSLDYKFGYPDNDARWIWETEYTDDPGSNWPEDGRVVLFEREFCIPCDPESATLHITADNGYEVWINGNFVGSAQVFDYGGVDWEDSDLTGDWVTSSGWQSVESFTINPGWLSTGKNTLEILAGNEQMNNGNAGSNPAGLIYQLDIEYGDDCEYCPTQGEDDCEGGCAKFNVSNNKGNPDNIFKYDAFGTLVGSFDLSAINTSSQGVASTDDYIYVLDLADKKAYRYTCCGSPEGVSRKLNTIAGSSIGNPNGLAIYSADYELWVVSANDKKIYGYSLAAAYPDSGTPLPPITEISLVEDNTGATGLAVDSDYLYVLDDDKVSSTSVDVIYRYPKSGGTELPSKVLKEMGGDPLDLPSGAMVDGGSIWVVDRGTNMVYQYNLDDLFDGSDPTLDATWEFSLDGANDKATGL